jgi:hypothetical protein
MPLWPTRSATDRYMQGEFRRLPQPRLEDFALLLRRRLSALRGNGRALAEGIDVLLMTLNQLVDIDLRQANVNFLNISTLAASEQAADDSLANEVHAGNASGSIQSKCRAKIRRFSADRR